MSDQLVWHKVYGKPTLFEAGVAVGDVYPSRGSDAEVWRCRLWSENRLQGGREKLVLASAGEETAKQTLLLMLERARGQELGVRLPEVQGTLREIAAALRMFGYREEPGRLAEKLDHLAGQMSRKPRVTHAPVASARMTPEKAEEIRRLKAWYPAMTQHEIGRLTGTNQGRVSEVLAGKRV